MVQVGKPLDVYVRVSRVGGRQHLISPQDQERRGRALAKERGLKVGKVLTDLDESGGKLDRPGLQEALVRVRSGESGGMIVAWLDRLSRDSEQALRLVREISESGGAIYAPDAPSDWTSPEGELQAGIVFAFAQYIRKRSRASFERAKEGAIASGVPVASRIRVGYRQREDRRLEPDPVIAPVILKAFEMRAAGHGPTDIGRHLEAHGVLTTAGSKVWTKPAVMDVLKSRVYLGELSYGKDRRFVNTKSHEPIVDLATWEAAQNPGAPPRLRPTSGGRYSLSGMLRCAACGYAMQATTTSNKRRIYRCGRRYAGGVCPVPVRAGAIKVEAAAEAAFWAVTEDLRASPSAADDDVATELAAAEEHLTRAVRRLTQALAPEVQDAAGESWSEMIRERRQERDDAAAAVGRLRAAKSADVELPPAETLRALWEEATPVERRELFAARFDVFTLGRRGEDLVLAAFPVGSFPDGVSRRGYASNPQLRPIDAPPSARVLTLK